MEVKGENVCPRCHQGVLTKRKGKNGVFWGCSNYPKCRMTCNDKDGKPDLEDAKARLARRPRAAAPAAVSASALAWQAHPSSAQAAGRYSSAESADDIAALNALFSPADYAARMEADAKSYAAQQKKASSSWQSWADKPEYSASPMEHMAKDEASSEYPARAAAKAICAASTAATASSGAVRITRGARPRLTTTTASHS